MDQDSANTLIGLVSSGLGLVVAIAVYVYLCFCILTIAKKTGQTQDLWMAWVPILQWLLLLRIAKKPTWWILLLLIPCVNFVIIVITMMAVSEARGKPGWIGILMIVPCVNILIPGYLAFVD